MFVFAYRVVFEGLVVAHVNLAQLQRQRGHKLVHFHLSAAFLIHGELQLLQVDRVFQGFSDRLQLQVAVGYVKRSQTGATAKRSRLQITSHQTAAVVQI